MKGLIHGCVAAEFDDKMQLLCHRDFSIDSPFNHHSVRPDGPQESRAGVDLLTAPAPSIADNTEAAPIIDGLPRNSPLLAASFTNGSIMRATHPEGWLEPLEDSWDQEVKG